MAPSSGFTQALLGFCSLQPWSQGSRLGWGHHSLAAPTCSLTVPRAPAGREQQMHPLHLVEEGRLQPGVQDFCKSFPVGKKHYFATWLLQTSPQFHLPLNSNTLQPNIFDSYSGAAPTIHCCIINPPKPSHTKQPLSVML